MLGRLLRYLGIVQEGEKDLSSPPWLVTILGLACLMICVIALALGAYLGAAVAGVVGLGALVVRKLYLT